MIKVLLQLLFTAGLWPLLFLTANANPAQLQGSDVISISGLVSDPEGNPIRNVSVILIHSPWGNPDLGDVIDSTSTDVNGHYSVSHIPTSIDRDRSQEYLSAFELGSAYPNPFTRESGALTGQTHLPVRIADEQIYDIEVYSIDGKLIKRSRNHLSQGLHTVSIGLPRIAGVYLVRVRGNNVNEVQRITSLGGGGVNIDVRSGTLRTWYQNNNTVSASFSTSTERYVLRVNGGVYYGNHEAEFQDKGHHQHDITMESILGPVQPWLVQARERIDQLRKADFEINVTDTGGKPIPDAKVDISMTRHGYRFGSLLGERRFEGMPTPEDALKHLDTVERYFNKVTAVRENDHVGETALEWLNERDIFVRGHYLMWARIQPGDRYGQPDEWPEDNEVLREIAFQRIEDMITWAGDRIKEWNLINHIVTHVADHTGYDHLFGKEIFADVINFARELAPPGTELWVNEGNVLTGSGSRIDLYYDVIEQLIDMDAPPDGIGFMSHFKRENDLITMDELQRRLDLFAELVPNLQLTELDIDIDDELMHAAYLHDVMTLAFSHPHVSSITIWQIWGNTEQNITLWRPDWTIKPAGEVWLDLVHNQWWTNEQRTTNSNGSIDIRGFKGDYEITVQVGDESKTLEVHLESEGKNLDFVF